MTDLTPSGLHVARDWSFIDEPIRHGTMGGTVENVWNKRKDGALPGSQLWTPRYLSRFDRTLNHSPICFKESGDVEDPDRLKMIAIADGAAERFVYISSGTYSMPDFARVLRSNMLMPQQKTTIFWGSWVPMRKMVGGDGGFNAGFAMAQFGLVDPDVYVAMNGELIIPHDVYKKLDESRFESSARIDRRGILPPMHVIGFGGSPDFEIDPLAHRLVPAEFSQLPEYFEELNLNRRVVVSVVTTSDSRWLTDDQYSELKMHIKESPMKQILVSCGIFGMAKLAGQLLNDIPECFDPENGKRVGLTGGLFPLIMEFSDVPFNYGFTTGFLDHQPPGLYMTLGGRPYTSELLQQAIDSGKWGNPTDTMERMGFPRRAPELSLDMLDADAFGSFL